jgi:hypothetical protein
MLRSLRLPLNTIRPLLGAGNGKAPGFGGGYLLAVPVEAKCKCRPSPVFAARVSGNFVSAGVLESAFGKGLFRSWLAGEHGPALFHRGSATWLMLAGRLTFDSTKQRCMDVVSLEVAWVLNSGTSSAFKKLSP